MKRRGFFKAALALVGLKAIGADRKLLPNSDWVDAEPSVLVSSAGDEWHVTTIRYEAVNGKWQKVSEHDGLE